MGIHESKFSYRMDLLEAYHHRHMQNASNVPASSIFMIIVPKSHPFERKKMSTEYHHQLA